jgi:MFS family permease
MYQNSPVEPVSVGIGEVSNEFVLWQRLALGFNPKKRQPIWGILLPMTWSNIKERAERVGFNRVVLALSFARMGDAIGNAILMVVLPLYVDVLPSPSFAVSEPMRVGFLLSVYGFVAAVVQPIVGIWSDRMGRRKWLIQLGLIVMAASTVAFVFAGTYSHLFWLRAGQGLGLALTVPASMALLTSFAHAGDLTLGGSEAQHMSIVTGGFTLGVAIGPLLAGLLAPIAFDLPFLIGGTLCLIAAWTVHRHAPETTGQNAPSNQS